jgi:predicted MFS family arabinose efflux permease
VRAYLDVFRIREARRLYFAMLPVRLGYSMFSIALVLLAYDRTGSFTTAGLAAGSFVLWAGVTAPIRGSLVDKYGQTTPLLFYVPAFVLSVALVPLVSSGVGLVVMAGVSGAVSPPLIASARPLWRIIVGDRLVRTAYAADAVQMQVTLVVGPALAAVIAKAFDPVVTPFVIAASVLVGGVLFVMLESSRSWRSEKRLAHMGSALRAPGIRTMLGLAISFGAAFGALQVSLPAKAESAGSAASGGLWFALLAGGMVLGGTWWGTRVHTGSPLRALAISMSSFAVLMVPAAALPPGIPLGVALVAAGICLGPPMPLWMELIDRAAPPGTAVSAFTWLISVEAGGTALAVVLAGSLAESFGPTAAVAVSAVAALFVAPLLVVRRRSLRPGQWPAASQDGPAPMETSSGTSRA